jgi:hypothetical protein
LQKVGKYLLIGQSPCIEGNSLSMSLCLSPRIAICLIASAALHLFGGEMAPDFSKFAPVALFPAAKEAARTNQIPIAGIDPADQADTLKPGDSVTAQITIFEKRGTKSQWLLYVEAVEPTAEEKARKSRGSATWYVGAGDKVTFAGSEAPVSLRLLGPFAEGTAKPPKMQDQRARITLDPGFLSIGLDEAAGAFHRMRQSRLKGALQVRNRPFTEDEVAKGKKTISILQLSAKEQRAIAGSQLALMSYVHLVQETPGLDSLFYKVVKLPSVWSVVRHLGVSVSVNLEKNYVAPTAVSNWNLEPETVCYTFPLSLRVNDQLALLTTLVVAPPRPPLLQCGGIVGMLAEKPDDKNTYLLLRIISARHEKDKGVATPVGSGL